MGKIWSPDCKFWLPTYFVYNSQNSTKVNMILYFTLRTRKVPKEELKLLKTVLAWVRPIATVVLKWYVSGPKVMILLKLLKWSETQKIWSPWFSWLGIQVLLYIPFLFLQNVVPHFRHLSLLINNTVLGLGSLPPLFLWQMKSAMML